MTPKRIQRRRAKGWRLPKGAICVDRSTPWGNPFVVARDGTAAECVERYRILLSGLICITAKPSIEEQQVALRYAGANIKKLRGKNLACWCRDGQPCHGDVLLEIANLNRERGAGARPVTGLRP